MDDTSFSIIINSIIESIKNDSTGTYKFLRTKRKGKIQMMSSNRRRIPKNVGYVKVIEEFPSDIFQLHFRMTKDCFTVILRYKLITTIIISSVFSEISRRYKATLEERYKRKKSRKHPNMSIYYIMVLVQPEYQ